MQPSENHHDSPHSKEAGKAAETYGSRREPSTPPSAAAAESILGDVRRSAGEPYLVGTRQLLAKFGMQRRGSNNIRIIREALEQVGLCTDPDIETADYYGTLRLMECSAKDGSQSASEVDGRSSGAVASSGGASEWLLSSLKADDDPFYFATYDDKVEDIRNRMIVGGPSKLPLFLHEDDRSALVGTITIKDLLANPNADSVADLAQTSFYEVPTSEPLFAWIPLILEQGAVYGRDADGKIVQIYTTRDVAHYLDGLAQMFLRVNELEDLTRQFLTRIPEEEVLSASQSHSSLSAIPLTIDDDGAVVEVIGDHRVVSGGKPDHVAEGFMFGEYLRTFGDPAFWEKFMSESPIGDEKARRRFLLALNDARKARNKVAHANTRDELTKLKPNLEAAAMMLRQLPDPTTGI